MPIDIEFTPLLHRRTKIVATLGPVSSSAKTIGELIDAGVNVFRLNMSHGDHASHTEVFNTIRQVSNQKKAHIAILADLCGPKIRCGLFENGSINLLPGEQVIVTTREVTGKQGLIPSAYHQLNQDAQVGTQLLFDDGKLELLVEKIDQTELHCKVIQGGELKDRRASTFPTVKFLRRR